MQISKNIIKDAIGNYLEKTGSAKVNISLLSRETGIELGSLWHYLNKDRDWPAESFLRALVFFGALKAKDNVATIRLSDKSESYKLLKCLVNKNFSRYTNDS